jgi:hypothetical protein
MDEYQIENIIVSYYIDNGLTTMPLLMKEFNSNYKGKADNQAVSAIINKVIAGR